MATRARKEDDRFVMQRAEDHSFFAAFDYYTTKYKLLIWLFGLALLAVGFDFKTPKSIFADLQAQITKNKIQVDSVLTPHLNRVDEKIDVLLRLRCVDKTLSADQRLLSGLEDFCNTHPITGGAR